jgi:hypothetical protein
MHRLFSIEFQSSQINQIQQSISKIKMIMGQICPKRPEMARSGPDLRRRAREREFKWLTGRVRSSAAPGDRIGMRRSWPFDQVAIDGQRSSSPRQKSRTAARLGFGRGLLGAHLGWFGDDLVVKFGYGGSEKVGVVVREVNVEAARLWACSFTTRCSGYDGDGVGYLQI